MPDPVLAPVIGVDLGASFTKVSFRPAWVGGPHYSEVSKMVVIDGSPLVPSLVIYSENNNRWLFGKEAAGYFPTHEDRVYANWKSSLYSKHLNQKVDGDMDAASKFFEWLGGELRKTGIPVRDSKIKICLPAFDGAEQPGQLLVERMKRCGWAGKEHSTIEEPRANTIGMFGHGSNAAHRSMDDGQIYPTYMENFPPGGFVISHLRRHALTNGPRHASFLIIDIGSFTTDLSLAVLDAQRDGDCIEQTTQHSFELGLVEHYEKPLFERLLIAKQLNWHDLNFNDRERIKNSLNSDEQIVVATARSGNVTFGGYEDQRVAQELASVFAEHIFEVLQRFMQGRIAERVLLTGGGVSVDTVNSQLRKALISQGIQVLPNEGIGSASLGNGHSSTISWELSGETLERLATAIGASSVLMDLPTHEPPPLEMLVSTNISEWIICSCNGGNKDCAVCGGVGMHRQ
jgi:hypothetical protein